MKDWKSIVASRTVWANIVGLAALAGAGFGFDFSPADQDGVTEAFLQVVAGLSFLASTLFRVLAKTRLSL